MSGLDLARLDPYTHSASFIPAEPGPHVIEIMVNWLVADARYGESV